MIQIFKMPILLLQIFFHKKHAIKIIYGEFNSMINRIYLSYLFEY